MTSNRNCGTFISHEWAHHVMSFEPSHYTQPYSSRDFHPAPKSVNLCQIYSNLLWLVHLGILSGKLVCPDKWCDSFRCSGQYLHAQKVSMELTSRIMFMPKCSVSCCRPKSPKSVITCVGHISDLCLQANLILPALLPARHFRWFFLRHIFRCSWLAWPIWCLAIEAICRLQVGTTILCGTRSKYFGCAESCKPLLNYGLLTRAGLPTLCLYKWLNQISSQVSCLLPCEQSFM